jgi:hypothetical protein
MDGSATGMMKRAVTNNEKYCCGCIRAQSTAQVGEYHDAAGSPPPSGLSIAKEKRGVSLVVLPPQIELPYRELRYSTKE